jgi:hypothetical protein
MKIIKLATKLVLIKSIGLLCAQTPPIAAAKAAFTTTIVDTNRLAASEIQSSVSEQGISRQSIFDPSTLPDITLLTQKPYSFLTAEEQSLISVLRPDWFCLQWDKAKTPAQKEKDRIILQVVLDPIGTTRELDKTKSSDQRHKEQIAEHAVLNPRYPSLKEFQLQSIAKP